MQDIACGEMGEYRREDDVLRLYFVIDYNNTQQHTRTTTISAVYSRPLTLCTRLTPTTRCAHNTRHTQEHVSSSSNRRFCQRRRRHHDSARSPPSPHFSLSSTGAAEGSGFHSRRASRRARITQHTHRTEAGRRHPRNSTRRAVNTQLQQRRPPQLISRRTQSPGSRRPGHIS